MILSYCTYAFDFGKVLQQTVTGAQQLAEAAKDITPGEEHYIGRAVAAMILSKYPLMSNPGLTRYLNEVGLLVAYSSERPETFGGYHFAVLNSDEPNAFACPGGLILVNKGLLKQIQNEDELAGVLGHEVAHVADRDGIKAIKKSRWTKFAFYTAGEVGKHYTPQEVSQLVGEFQNVVTDVAKRVMDAGYSQKDEKEADEKGMIFAANAGYNPNALIDFINHEAAAGIGHATGPFSSHPKHDIRVMNLTKVKDSLGSSAATEAIRTARFKAAIAGL